MSDWHGQFDLSPVREYLGVVCGRCAKGPCKTHGTDRDWCKLAGHLFEFSDGEWTCIREGCGIAWEEEVSDESINWQFDRPSNRW